VVLEEARGLGPVATCRRGDYGRHAATRGGHRGPRPLLARPGATATPAAVAGARDVSRVDAATGSAGRPVFSRWNVPGSGYS
jgi:hypothetical protein